MHLCVILANTARGGWKEVGRWSGKVAECSGICQQGRVSPGTGSGCEEALLRSESTQPTSARWGSVTAAGSLLQGDRSSIQGLGNRRHRECSGPGLGDPDAVSLGR